MSLHLYVAERNGLTKMGGDWAPQLQAGAGK